MTKTFAAVVSHRIAKFDLPVMMPVGKSVGI